MRKTILSILTAVAVVCMVVLGISLNAASILDNGKNEKEVKSEKVLAPQWYRFKTSVSSNPTRAQALEPSNYEAVGESAPCSSDEIFCGIFADDNSDVPNLGSATMANTVINAYFNDPSTYTNPILVERD